MLPFVCFYEVVINSIQGNNGMECVVLQELRLNKIRLRE